MTAKEPVLLTVLIGQLVDPLAEMMLPPLKYGVSFVIVGYLGLRQAGKAAEATTFLATWGPKADSTAWPFPVIKFLGHTLTATALLAQATDDNKMTEARTYVALDLIYAGTPQAARPHLEWVKLHGAAVFRVTGVRVYTKSNFPALCRGK